MNTPDTEWEKLKKEFIEELKLGKRGHFFRENPDGSVYILAYAGEFIDKLFSSRDTYWKERVENVLYDVEEHASQQDSDEEIGGMLRAVEIIRNHLDINANR